MVKLHDSIVVSIVLISNSFSLHVYAFVITKVYLKSKSVERNICPCDLQLLY